MHLNVEEHTVSSFQQYCQHNISRDYKVTNAIRMMISIELYTVSHKSHDPSFHKKNMEAGVMTSAGTPINTCVKRKDLERPIQKLIYDLSWELIQVTLLPRQVQNSHHIKLRYFFECIYLRQPLGFSSRLFRITGGMIESS